MCRLFVFEVSILEQNKHWKEPIEREININRHSRTTEIHKHIHCTNYRFFAWVYSSERLWKKSRRARGSADPKCHLTEDSRVIIEAIVWTRGTSQMPPVHAIVSMMTRLSSVRWHWRCAEPQARFGFIILFAAARLCTCIYICMCVLVRAGHLIDWTTD